ERATPPTNPLRRCQCLRASFLPRAFAAFDPGHGSCGGALAEGFGESATLAVIDAATQKEFETMGTQLQLGKPQLLNQGRPKKFTPEKIQQIRNLLERGKSRDEIAEIIGVTTGTLQVTSSKLGISLRRPTFDMGARLLRPRYQKNGSPNQSGSPPESSEKECAERPHAAPEPPIREEARSAAVATRSKVNDGIPAAFAIRMQYKGQERSTVISLDKEMIAQLAIEAEIRGMQIGELVAALIRAIVNKDLFHLFRDKAYAYMHGKPLAGRADIPPSNPDLIRIFEPASS